MIIFRGPATWVRLGDLNLSSDEDGMPRNYKIIERIKHPKFVHSSYYHDIGLVRLEEQIEFNEYVRPACLYMEERAEESNKRATATGWGKVDRGEKNLLFLKTKLTIYFLIKTGDFCCNCKCCTSF